MAQKEIQIFINGAAVSINKKETLSFQEVIELAYGKMSSNPNVTYTVTYSRAHGNKKGILVPRQEVKVKEGMVFNVSITSRS